MKNLSALIFLVILFGSSCSKEDPNPLTKVVVWQKEIPESEVSRFMYDPIIFKDLIVYPFVAFEGPIGKLVAYNKENGEKIWEWQEAFDEYGVDGFSLKSYVFENILICGDNNLTYGINLDTGETVWETRGNVFGLSAFWGKENLAYSSDFVYDDFSYLKETNVLDGSSRYLWEFHKTDEYDVYMGSPYPIEWQGKSYVTVVTAKWIDIDQNYFLNLYDLDENKLVWTSDTIPLQIPQSGTPGLRPQFSEGKILLANDAIYSYDIADGSMAWRADYGNKFTLSSHITAADGKVWGNNANGFCVGLDVHTGYEIFNVDTGGSASRVLFHDNKLYIASATSFSDGRNYLIILDANNGNIIKQIEAPYFEENWKWHFNRNMEIDPETGLLYTGDHRYAMCIDPWK